MRNIFNGFFYRLLKLQLFAGLMVLTGCTAAVLTSNYDSLGSGLRYYLPKTLVTIKIIPVGIIVNTPVTELSKEEKELVDTEGAVRKEIEIAGRYYNVLVKKDGTLAGNLITDLRLEISRKPEKSEDFVENVPDPDTGLSLNYQPSVLATDRVCIGVTENSLLSFAQVKVKDETSNIAISIAKLAGRLPGLGAFANMQIEQKKLTPEITLKIDPLDKQDWKAVEQAINIHFPYFRNQYRFSAKDIEYFLPSYKDGPTTCPENSLCYRTKAPLRMTLKHKHSGRATVTYATVVNRAVTHNIDITRAMFVEKVTLLHFKEGVLDTVKIDKPSEALEAAKLPLTLYDAVVTSALAAPGNFIGNITSNPTQQEAYKSLITQYQTNLANINTINTHLRGIRDADLTQISDEATALFNLTCQ